MKVSLIIKVSPNILTSLLVSQQYWEGAARRPGRKLTLQVSLIITVSPSTLTFRFRSLFNSKTDASRI